jgi:valine--pyruvate aminotransferase
VIGPPQLTNAISSINAVAGLANGNIGQVLVTDLLANDEIARVSDQVIRPFYQQKSLAAQELLAKHVPKELYKVHVSEGALFLWLWLKMPISSRQLYDRLKARGVLIVPGEYFFFGLQEPWEHETQCIRMTFSMPDGVVEEGIKILADELRQLNA